MRVILTDEAEVDLERIGDAIAGDSPPRAVIFVAELRKKCESIGATPRLYPVIRRYSRVALRRRVHGNYLIFYRIGRNVVTVLRILHGAMNYEELLFRM